MAKGPRLFIFADLLNKYNNVLPFRITKLTCNGWNNLEHSVANYSALTSISQPDNEENKDPSQGRRVIKAVSDFLRRSKEHDEFLQQQVEQYQKGKMFLSKIMGYDPKTMTENDIQNAITYLFPSALHEPKARAIFKDPKYLFAKKKEAMFDIGGRPYHFLFYTTKPNYSQCLHECAAKLEMLNKHLLDLGPNCVHVKTNLDFSSTRWMNKENFEKLFDEKLCDFEYDKLMESLERLLNHPYAHKHVSFILKYRVDCIQDNLAFKIPKIYTDVDGRRRITVEKCKRKKCTGTVEVISPGDGRLMINDKILIDFFDEVQPRHEVIYPLVLTDMLGKVDVKATLEGDGKSNQAFVVRYGISVALTALVEEPMLLEMKLRGLLDRDPRIRERDKPGMRGARRRYTWLKR